MNETFDYYLPEELIAQHPLKERDKARLMVIDRKKKEIREDIFSEVKKYFKKGDTLVLNNSRVIPARLRGTKKTGGKVEIFLLKKMEECRWEVLLRGNIKQGQECRITKDGRSISVNVLKKTEKGSYIAEFSTNDETEILYFGETPLPPYIKRQVEKEDRASYQTVYAKKDGSVAAPTAGLHFTNEMLKEMEEAGINVVYVTLHIGWASFKLLKKEQAVEEEYIEVSPETADIINRTKRDSGKVIAVGTSTVRTLESSVDRGKIVPVCRYTNLFIKGNFRFKIVDALITNFHLPGSTHLYLVCAFAETEMIEKAYKKAVEKRYRFYSYGDAMLII
ncbi:MAG: tRNA preQ1(34) S-adenosylmethionine ribosyltransferase-isomerase QueA [Candidatus Ratteibacteria bacterium]|nr:tRNA preQ1(34) S-adenosylmethionine ribosyltransferase-isomerase QueA [Candidatus Ratteibacteria bacterium]